MRPRVGASFIEASRVKDIVVRHDIVYAKPGVKPLKYDVYTPRGARNLPIIVIIHGGGWTATSEVLSVEVSCSSSLLIGQRVHASRWRICDRGAYADRVF